MQLHISHLLFAEVDRSPEGLERYKQSMLELQEGFQGKGKRSVHVTITLQEPIPADSALEFLERHDIRPVFTYAFARSKSGELVIVGDQLQNSLGEGLRRVAEDEGAELLGVVSFVAEVWADRLASVQGDDRVFLVDVSADQSLAENPGNCGYMHHFAWELYQQQHPGMGSRIGSSRAGSTRTGIQEEQKIGSTRIGTTWTGIQGELTH